MQRKRTRVVGLVLAASLLISMLAAPANAEPLQGLTGVFTGTASVGKWFQTVCDKNGLGQPTGRGLYAPKPFSLKPLGPANDDHQREKNGTWQFSGDGNAVGILNPKSEGGGGEGIFAIDIDACGYLDRMAGTSAVNADKGPRYRGIGAACGASKGHHGLGKVTAINLVNGSTQSGKLQQLGWKFSIGGLIPLLGDLVTYENDDVTKKKKFQIIALVNADGAFPCVGLKPTGNVLSPLCTQLDCNGGNGAQIFSIVGAFKVMNLGSDTSIGWNDIFDAIGLPKGPNITGDDTKKCKGVGDPAPVDGTGKKQHTNKPGDQACPSKKPMG